MAIGKVIQKTDSSSSNKGKRPYDKDVAIAEDVSTEAIWFGFDEEVPIAISRKTSVGKFQTLLQ